MDRDPNVVCQSFMNGLLTEVEPSMIWCLICSKANEYTTFYEEALKIIIAFPSSYLQEMGFSALTFIKEKYGNSLGEKHPMRLALSDVESRF